YFRLLQFIFNSLKLAKIPDLLPLCTMEAGERNEMERGLLFVPLADMINPSAFHGSHPIIQSLFRITSAGIGHEFPAALIRFFQTKRNRLCSASVDVIVLTLITWRDFSKQFRFVRNVF